MDLPRENSMEIILTKEVRGLNPLHRKPSIFLKRKILDLWDEQL